MPVSLPLARVRRAGHQAATAARAVAPLARKAVRLAPPTLSTVAHRVRPPRGAEVAQAGFSAWDTRAARARELAAQMSAAGLDYVDVSTYNRGGRRSWAIRAADRAGLVGRVVPALRAAGWQAAVHPAAVLFWREVITPAGDVLVGPEDAITVETWTPAAPGRAECTPGALIPPPWHRGTYLSAETFQRAQAGDHTPPQEWGEVWSLRPPFPIDAVYTWVDGTDPAWRASYRATVGDEGPAPIAAERFVPHDELRYALRSLEYFASWVRQVVLVVGQEPPAWLRRDHPKLRIVRHEEFMDPATLPTFNSHSIEARLHRIDGLADHFLYLNDDVFFGRPLSPAHFFHANGLARFFVSPGSPLDPNPVSEADSTATAARKNARELLRAELGFLAPRRLQHTPHAMRLDVLREMEARWPEQFAATAASRVRSAADYPVEAYWAQWYAYATGRAVPGALEGGYVLIDKPRARMQYLSLTAARAKDVFCLNESARAAAPASGAYAAMEAFLRGYFPVPSSFERDQPGTEGGGAA